jgi:hypothetical protein
MARSSGAPPGERGGAGHASPGQSGADRASRDGRAGRGPAAVAGRAVEGFEVQGTPPDQPPVRVTRFEGDVARTRGTTLTPGEGLEPGDGLVVRGEGRADLDLGDLGRVLLERDTEIRVSEGGAAQVLLLRGAVHVFVPPGLSGPRPPLRVATPAASIELGGSGEFYALAHPSGMTWVVGLAGLTTVANGESDGRRRLRTIELAPGRAVLVGARGLGEPTEGPARIDAARTAAATLLEGSSAPDRLRARRDLEDAARRLDESLLWLESETRRGRDLTNQHREAVRAGRSADAIRLQRELVSHAQQLYVLRQVATARWERVLAGSLYLARTAGGAESSAAAVAGSRRDRVQSLLGP